MTEFKGVKGGDRVRLTRANGDEVTVTVKSCDDRWLDSEGNTYDADNWDTFEVLPKPLPTEPGAYLDKDGDTWVIFRGRSELTYVCDTCSSGTCGICNYPEKFAPFTRLVPEATS